MSQDINKTIWRGPPDAAYYNDPGSIDIIQTVPNADRLEINATNAVLLIHNVTLQDEGVYKCTASHSGGFKTEELRLDVTNGKTLYNFIYIEYKSNVTDISYFM